MNKLCPWCGKEILDSRLDVCQDCYEDAEQEGVSYKDVGLDIYSFNEYDEDE